MKPDQNIIKYRKRIPRFIREDSWKKSSLDNVWRKPKGRQSKMREQRDGKPCLVKVGYKVPKLFSGLFKSGHEIVKVMTLDELKKVNPKTQVVELKGTLGNKRKVELVRYAKDNGIYLINLNPEKYLTSYDKEMTKRKEGRSELLKKRKEDMKSKTTKKEEKKAKKEVADSKKEEVKSDDNVKTEEKVEQKKASTKNIDKSEDKSSKNN